MTKRNLKKDGRRACEPYTFGAQARPVTGASHVGWVKPRPLSRVPALRGIRTSCTAQRRTQQYLSVRRVSLRFTHPAFERVGHPGYITVCKTGDGRDD